MENRIKIIIDELMNDINDRRGFVFDDVDALTIAEIKKDWGDIIEKGLKVECNNIFPLQPEYREKLIILLGLPDDISDLGLYAEIRERVFPPKGPYADLYDELKFVPGHKPDELEIELENIYFEFFQMTFPEFKNNIKTKQECLTAAARYSELRGKIAEIALAAKRGGWKPGLGLVFGERHETK